MSNSKLTSINAISKQINWQVGTPTSHVFNRLNFHFTHTFKPSD